MALSSSTSFSRQPRAYAQIAGSILSPIECSVSTSRHQSADTFYLKFPLDNDAGLDEKYFANTAPIPVTIMGSNDITFGGVSTLLIGQADEPQIDFARRTVELKGRDLTGNLIDLKTSEKFQNLSRKDLITKLAKQAGLTVNFSGDTDQAGLQYDQDFTEITDSDSCWNVIVDAAKRLGAIAFVKGSVLYIQPIDQEPSSNYSIVYQRPTFAQIESGNFVLLLANRNLNLAKDVEITVQSWQHKQGETVTSKYKSTGKDTSSSKLLYAHRSANLTKGQQDRYARNHLKATLLQERTVLISNLPGDVTVIPGLMGLALSGTGTAFDQNYVLANVLHRFSFDNGYLMDLHAHSQDASRGEPTQEQ